MSGCYRARCTAVIEITNEGSVNKRRWISRSTGGVERRLICRQRSATLVRPQFLRPVENVSRHSSARALKQLGGNASNGAAAARIWLAKFLTAFLLNLHPRLMHDSVTTWQLLWRHYSWWKFREPNGYYSANDCAKIISHDINVI